MRLLKTHSCILERQGYEADREPRTKRKKGKSSYKDNNKSSTKAIAIPPARRVGRESVYGKRNISTKNQVGPCAPYAELVLSKSPPASERGGGIGKTKKENNTE